MAERRIFSVTLFVVGLLVALAALFFGEDQVQLWLMIVGAAMVLAAYFFRHRGR